MLHEEISYTKYFMSRNFVRLLLVIFAISTSAWTFNSELMADVLSQAQSEISLGFGQTEGNGHPFKTQDSCNHGCHVVNHLQGQTSRHFVTVVAVISSVFQEVAASFSSRLSVSQFKPPRLLF